MVRTRLGKLSSLCTQLVFFTKGVRRAAEGSPSVTLGQSRAPPSSLKDAFLPIWLLALPPLGQVELTPRLSLNAYKQPEFGANVASRASPEAKTVFPIRRLFCLFLFLLIPEVQ